jgi:hypothetical protein
MRGLVGPFEKIDQTDFLNQRDREIIASARPELAVSGMDSSSVAQGVDISAMSVL